MGLSLVPAPWQSIHHASTDAEGDHRTLAGDWQWSRASVAENNAAISVA